jgi:hypothetical protein
MEPADFPEANAVIQPPIGTDKSQVKAIRARLEVIRGGNLDGAKAITTAWKPSAEDIDRITQGGLVHLTCLEGLPPHILKTKILTA